MKKLLISIFFILVALFAIDRLGGVVMRHVSQNTQDIFGPKMKHLAIDADEDIILMGTSRCNMHYVPSIISDSLQMTVYNGGIDATKDIFSHYIMLGHLLSHHTPKIIVLDTRNEDLLGVSDFSTIGFFAPYFGRNEGSDSVMREAGKYWAYKVSHLYRYNAKAPSNLLGLAVNSYGSNDNGYIPLARPDSHPQALIHKDVTNLSPDSLKHEYYQRFVRHCREKGITLILSISPCYSIIDPSYYAALYDFAEHNQIPLLDYHSAEMFIDCPHCFKDDHHLWDSSARIFSAHFAHDIKQLITDSTAN